MDLRSYIAIIRKYLPLIVACGLIGLLAGYGLYASKPKQYAADVQFYVSTPVTGGTSAQSAGQFATARMVSYAELLQSQQLGERVVKASGVDLTGDKVAQEITANTTVDSVLVKATVTDTDKARALKIAQGVDKVFGPMVDELDNQGRQSPVVNIRTVSAPALRSAPVAPKAKMTLLAGLGLGVLLAMAFALLRELLDTSVKDEDELRHLSGAPVIGTIPAERTAETSPLLAADGHGQRVEAHRKLRTNLNFLGATEPSRVIAVTAPMPGDGASTVAANTAVAFAETGERVCLVDADLRSGGAGRLFDGIDGAGLSGVLAGSAPLASAVRRAANGVDVLPAGELPPNPAALLAQPAFADLLADLRSRYDHVVIDTPALLPVADAAAVAGLADGVVLVTRSGRTTARQVERSRTALEAIRAHLLGVVANRANLDRTLRQARG